MYICICNAVTDGQIKQSIKNGNRSFEAVHAELGVAGCCGQCEHAAREVIDETLMQYETAPFATDLMAPA